MKYILLFLFKLSLELSFAQTDGENFIVNNKEEKSCPNGKQKKKPATFKGKLKTYLKQNLQYPEEALIKRLEDTVWVTFDIDVYGNIKDPRIDKAGQIFFDEEALRVIKLMPAWSPATINGEAVSECQIIPIIFKLPEKGHSEK
ncbi:TonB family domain-containing protein [Sporocytophaga myxococcoides]|uniref:TonB family domain-containing protein n=1 Tax=Sporocytophaga myxococcoides TaxID=153721 RepID=A0A098LFW5_9BACT|nr:energy transducer TonB [Sporocytophaga myxococcoides]GAL85354.1 TonB family domain-containing protein [Sporocytophaga myxococcoides]